MNKLIAIAFGSCIALGITLVGCSSDKGDGGSNNNNAVPGDVGASAANLDGGPAQDFGTCIPFTPYTGYTTCLLSKAQSANGLLLPTRGGGTETTADAGVVLPESVDPREALSKCVTVHNQENTGWCVYHATTAVHEMMHCGSTRGGDGVASPTSVNHFWHVSNGKRPVTEKDLGTGWFIETAAASITKADQYLVDEASWPMLPGSSPSSSLSALFNDTRPPDPMLDQDSIHGASGSTNLPARDVVALKAALASGAYATGAVPIFRNIGWDRTYDPATGKEIKHEGKISRSGHESFECACDCPDKKPCTPCPVEASAETKDHCYGGFHAIAFVGYRDDATAPGGGWLYFLNSWGTSFGGEPLPDSGEGGMSGGVSYAGFSEMSYDYYASWGSAVAFEKITDRKRKYTAVTIPEAATTGRACGRTQSGGMRCWGVLPIGNGIPASNNGNAFVATSMPVLASDRHVMTDVVQMTRDARCALRSDKRLYCWGQNIGELGDGLGYPVPLMYNLPSISGFLNVAQAHIGSGLGCAVNMAGNVDCAGSNTMGSLAVGNVSLNNRWSNVPNRVITQNGNPLSDIVEVAMGGYSVCARTTNGAVYCWGANDNGQLGLGSIPQQPAQPFPFAFATLVTGGAKQLSMSVNTESYSGVHTCALTTSGTIQCWGANAYGQLGNGVYPDPSWGASRAVPQTVVSAEGGALDKVTSMCAAPRFGCASRTDGSLWCWGGEDPSAAPRLTAKATPAQVTAITDVGQVACGGEGSLAFACALIRSDGSIRCWGSNRRGQLGRGTASETPSTVPADVH